MRARRRRIDVAGSARSAPSAPPRPGVAHGELVALVGPTGSGKTTMLRTIAGFERPDAGTVRIAGREVAGPGTWVEPERRRIGMVFQHGALFPHLTVGATSRSAPRPRARRGLARRRRPRGSRSRVPPRALGRRASARRARPRARGRPGGRPARRAVRGPGRGAARDVARGGSRVLRAPGATAVLVTHDQAEALSLADRLAVVRAGRIEQEGTPEEVYGRPAAAGSPSSWARPTCCPAPRATASSSASSAACRSTPSPPAPVEVVVRPESVAIGPRAGGQRAAPTPSSCDRSFFGHDQLVELELAERPAPAQPAAGRPAWRPGDRVRVWIDGPVSALASSEPAGTAR